jgi:5-formyltetrahydrofolate cyclo-ligase
MQLNLTKPQLRQQLLRQRRAMDPAQWQQKSQQICHQVQQISSFHQAQTILSYCSHHQEPDLMALMADPSKIWGLPRCVQNTGQNTLVWHQWQHQPLHPGAYGILEPAVDSPVLQADQVDLILVPCVACDRRGYRLGYGGGFYDRLFTDPDWKKLPTIGITFDFALFEQLPIDPWDSPLRAVMTENGASWVL